LARTGKTAYVKQNQKTNLRLQPLSRTKLVISLRDSAGSTPIIGRAESVLLRAYQCLFWSVSKCAPFISGNGSASQGGDPMKKAHPKDSPDDLVDTALDCCQNIQTLAQLLQRAGVHPISEAIDPLLVSNSGYMIGREIENLRQTLNEIHEQWPGASTRSRKT
jgi:hypothetical protein